MTDIEAAGGALAVARREGHKMAAYPCAKPATISEALAMQDAMAMAMGAPVRGWKVGLTSARAQELCGVDAPLAGPVFEGTIFESGAILPLVEGDLGVIEAEIGFRMKADLPPRGRAYGRQEVMAAVGEVLGLFEWVNKRLPGGLREAAEWLVADGTINRALICGAAQAFDPEMDLLAERVRVTRDGEVLSEGAGSNAMGDPVAVLEWLAGDLNARGKGLHAGDVIATGLICDVVQAVPGARIEAEFSTLGRVVLEIEGAGSA
ncbi:2-keto-4-pentenoate hydratase [Aquicoccus sp. G2-2]|uniref:2-keto-4-pentenoate hydratase n=1 Tax=Aquicoccus sp. G2-2 TaxID=3092120 RepID=UPI002ADF7A04|nr:fumarylacetoacetate hydrolase family protein [Aquicoccus sp. G2-2]MEA1113728.1 hypothetical protein [Aquicoccus sp. G2-2]